MNLSDQLHETARHYPEKIAYIFQGQQTTYQELEKAVSQFACQLHALGCKGDHIALILGNSPHFIIGLYGALRIGAVVIPINPQYTPNEIAYMVRNGDVKLLVTMDILLEKVENIANQLADVHHVIYCESKSGLNFDHLNISSKLKSFTDMMKTPVNPFEWPKLHDEDVALILYTSGTTGKPKGAMLTHKNLYSNAKDTADYLQISGSDRVIAALPMFHVFCLTVSLNAPLMNGGTVLVMPKFSPQESFRLARQYKATIFAGVPTMYNYLLQSGKGSKADLASIRLCISGGAAMPVSLLKNFEKTFDVIISEGYGLSEASPVTCFNPLDRPRKPGSIGTNIVHVENKVVDELGEEVPCGEVGELVVKGPNVMKGYYKMPEETASTIIDGWLHTGDMARMDDEGYFYIVDRKKDMIIVGGYNVYPREVEEVLFSHPQVAEAAVIGVPDPDSGEAVAAFVVSNDATLTVEELQNYCTGHLAKYKVPTRIEFLKEIPKNTTGKILRRSLRDTIGV
ncbi:fatty acid--CoA ligase family protein [Virgibacillus sp. 179-BFC.A HS]|uniref:Fatty acid--CoA ligase family protein n=1 Tax=Tigheibacillus jepli TaxID=3035914 RepID=A0ABU5CIP6_9BACI|nr:fatty acid--CoA ligase family protein [Virgibacillus sp. 179-BFC.A HS]MDY0406217.1 fatty acid--CoA ligase family protein [Virgibacillus sp. 179-BFC.A HS]